jgi:hypothetical protein
MTLPWLSLFDHMSLSQLKLTVMPQRRQSDPEFTAHVCGAIDHYIFEHNLTDVAAAKVLGVRKQMIGFYRKGKAMPGSQVLARACVEWGLRFTYRGQLIGADSLEKATGKPQVVPDQMSLPFDVPVAFRSTSEGGGKVELTVLLKRVV